DAQGDVLNGAKFFTGPTAAKGFGEALGLDGEIHCPLLITEWARSKFTSIMANWSIEVWSRMRILLVLVGLASVAWGENSLTRQERKDGFELLFNGKSLERWHSIKLRPEAGS